MRVSKLLKIFFVGWLMATTFAAATPATKRHRFHTSLTRIDYNHGQKIFEITIRLFTHDLTALLEKKSGRRVELDKTADVDRLILEYLNQNFVLTDRKGEKKTLRWVGKESEIDTVRIYLETASAENLENYKLQNTIFFESFPEQTNLVVCRYDGVKADLLFKVGDKEKEIVENKPAEKK